jgi:hypothetical protein
VKKSFAKLSLIETRVVGSDEITCHAKLVCRENGQRFKAKIKLGASWDQVKAEGKTPAIILDAVLNRLYESRMSVYMNHCSCQEVIIEGFDALFPEELIEPCRIRMNDTFLSPANGTKATDVLAEGPFLDC